MEKLTVSNIQKLHPNFVEKEEMYYIRLRSFEYWIKLYINSDFGLEYTIYDADHDIDGGVIDDFGIKQDEVSQTRCIVDLLENIINEYDEIRKMSEDEIRAFDEKLWQQWLRQVEYLKSEFRKKRECV